VDTEHTPRPHQATLLGSGTAEGRPSREHESAEPYEGHPFFPLEDGVEETRDIRYVSFTRRPFYPDGTKGGVDYCPEDFPLIDFTTWGDVTSRWGGGEYRPVGKNAKHQIVAWGPDWMPFNFESLPWTKKDGTTYPMPPPPKPRGAQAAVTPAAPPPAPPAENAIQAIRDLGEQLRADRVDRDRADRDRADRDRADRDRADRDRADRNRADRDRTNRERADREREHRPTTDPALVELFRAQTAMMQTFMAAALAPRPEVSRESTLDILRFVKELRAAPPLPRRRPPRPLGPRCSSTSARSRNSARSRAAVRRREGRRSPKWVRPSRPSCRRTR
jgi:hypothetical protein